MDLDDFFLTPHFLDRALDMALTPEQICATLTNPDEVYASPKYRGQLNYVKGDLCFGVTGTRQRGKFSVTTALWTNTEAWERDLSRGEYGNRKLRKDKT